MIAPGAPRVLALSEIEKHDGAVLIEYRDVRREAEWALLVERESWGILKFVTAKVGTLFLPVEDYDIHYRAWTRRPSLKDGCKYWWGCTIK